MVLPSSDGGGGYVAPAWQQTLTQPAATIKKKTAANSGAILPGPATSSLDTMLGLGLPTPAPRPTIAAPAPAPVPNATGQYSYANNTNVGGGINGGLSPDPSQNPAPTPVIPSEGDWLTQDAIYQALQARLNRGLNEFTANKDKQDSLIDTNAQMQHGDLGESQTQNAGDLLSRAAASGALLGNTGYAGLEGNLENEFAKRNSMVDTNAGTAHQSLIDALASLQGSNQDQMDQERASSLARRLAKYNL